MLGNSAQTWDSLWNGIDLAEQVHRLAKEKAGIRWKRMTDILRREFGSIQNLRCVELGAGLATVSTLLAQEGADISIIDYSPKALDICRSVLEKLGVKATFYQANGLSLPDELTGRFDVSMSFGLTEHFLAENRIAINKAHLNLLRSGGLTFISVPNAWCPPYRLFKFVAEASGRWNMAEEYPYSRRELLRVANQIGAQSASIFGDDFWDALRFVSPFRFGRKLLKLPESKRIRRERGTPADAYIAYAIVLCAKKP